MRWRTEKTRHHVDVDGWLFEIDEFLGENSGLTVAEIELPAVDASFPRPAWLGREVSNLERYYNVNLLEHPFTQWSVVERDCKRCGAHPGSASLMLLIGIAGTEVLAHERSWLTARGVAGVILFSRNYVHREQLLALVESIRAEAGGGDSHRR